MSQAQHSPAGSRRARRRTTRLGVVAVAAATALTLLPAPSGAWQADGPITEVSTSVQLGCQRVRHEASDAPSDFYSRVSNCGTMLSVEGSNLYAANTMSPGGPSENVRTWNPVSGDAFGDGSPSDPIRSITVVAGSDQDDPDLRVTETNAYVEGDDAYLTTVEVHNGSSLPIRGVLYRRADCNEAVYNPDGTSHTYVDTVLEGRPDGSIACTFPDPVYPGGDAVPRVVMTPHTPGSSYLGDDPNDERLFEELEANRQPYGNACVCGESIDFVPRIGLSWSYDIPPGGTATFQHSFAFAPVGGDIAEVSSLVGDVGPPPGADGVTRLAGASRFETAVAISQAVFPTDGSASAVALARADNFADALAGGPFANAQNASLLLTSTNSLHAATEAELQRVLPAGRTVFVLGGPVAVSDAVVQQVQALGYVVERIAGPSRYSTSVEIARRTTDAPREIWYADGNTFGNALAAGAAAAGRADAVMLLLNNTSPTQEVLDYVAEIDAQPDEFAVGTITEDSPDIAVPQNQTYDTGDPVGNAALLASDQLVFVPSDTSAVAVASSEAFPDGLAGGVHAGRLGIPLLLTPQAALAQPASDAMAEVAPLVEAFLYGGQGALSTDVEAAVAARLS